MATLCPYCNIEVSESSIEAEDGCCPECGSVISATSSFLGGDEADEYDDLDRPVRIHKEVTNSSSSSVSEM